MGIITNVWFDGISTVLSSTDEFAANMAYVSAYELTNARAVFSVDPSYAPKSTILWALVRAISAVDKRIFSIYQLIIINTQVKWSH
jgi:hypothetical protein